MEPRIRASAVFPRSKVLQNPKTVEAPTMYRTLRLVGVPYSLPLRTPKDRVMILQDATRKAFNDAEFHRDYKKLTDEDPDPLIPEEMEKRSGKFRAPPR